VEAAEAEQVLVHGNMVEVLWQWEQQQGFPETARHGINCARRAERPEIAPTSTSRKQAVDAGSSVAELS